MEGDKQTKMLHCFFLAVKRHRFAIPPYCAKQTARSVWNARCASLCGGGRCGLSRWRRHAVVAGHGVVGGGAEGAGAAHG